MMVQNPKNAYDPFFLIMSDSKGYKHLNKSLFDIRETSYEITIHLKLILSHINIMWYI